MPHNDVERRRRRRMIKLFVVKKTAHLFLISMIIAATTLAACSNRSPNWREASRASAGFAPLPAEESGAVLQAYAAAAWGWRGWFADHTWVAVKEENADSYTVYEVIGWRLRRYSSVVRASKDVPDRHWFGNSPKLLLDIRGDKAAALIPRVQQAVADYPYADEYTVFPGPNSNTFTAWIASEVPPLELKLPLRAVGKNYPLDKKE